MHVTFGEILIWLIVGSPSGQNIQPNSISSPVHELQFIKFPHLSHLISCGLSGMLWSFPIEHPVTT